MMPELNFAVELHPDFAAVTLAAWSNGPESLGINLNLSPALAEKLAALLVSAAARCRSAQPVKEPE